MKRPNAPLRAAMIHLVNGQHKDSGKVLADRPPLPILLRVLCVLRASALGAHPSAAPPAGLRKKRTPRASFEARGAKFSAGDVLLSHKVALAVPWALTGLTAVFGMGTGVALSLWPPAKTGCPARPEGRGDGSNFILTVNARGISHARTRRVPAGGRRCRPMIAKTKSHE